MKDKSEKKPTHRVRPNKPEYVPKFTATKQDFSTKTSKSTVATKSKPEKDGGAKKAYVAKKISKYQKPPATDDVESDVAPLITTRLCIKNLPPNFTEQNLKDHFAQVGPVTDARIVRLPNGTSRRFGFVGYVTAEQADKAVKHFNGTYIDTMKAVVELAYSKDSEQLDRPWSQHSVGSSKHKHQHPELYKEIARQERENKDGKKDKHGKPRKSIMESESTAKALGLTLERLQEIKNDVKFKEFLQIMKKGGSDQSKFWANDDLIAGGSKVADKPSVIQKPNKKVKLGDDDDDDDAEDEAFENPSIDNTDEEIKTPHETKVTSDVVHELALDENVSDLDYLKTLKSIEKDLFDSSDEEEDESSKHPWHSRGQGQDKIDDVDNQLENDGSVDAADNDKNGEGNDDVEMAGDVKTGKDNDDTEENANTNIRDDAGDVESQILKTGRLFLRNLAFSVTDKDILQLLTDSVNLPSTSIMEVKVPVDDMHRKKGYCFVTLMFPKDAVKAYRALDKKPFMGRLLHILPAAAPKQTAVLGEDYVGDPGTTGKSKTDLDDLTYKKKKEMDRRGGGEANEEEQWNSFFMRQDAVADSIATRYGVTKNQVLNDDDDDNEEKNKISSAVRLALGETHIIHDTKQYLSDEGINIEAFKSIIRSKGKVARHDRVILIKNIPFNTEEQEVYTLFGTYGQLHKVILPPTKTLALVEFVHPDEAKKAFRNLAYKKFKHVPLYLEWAPVNCLLDASTQKVKAKAKVNEQSMESNIVLGSVDDLDDSGASGEAGKCTLYVKNVNFITAESSLTRLFSDVGEVRSVTIAKKKNPKDPSTMISMGYAFVEYKTEKSAKQALAQLQGSKVDGHALELKLSDRQSTGSGTSSSAKSLAGISKDATTKIIIKNIPFEANTSDIRQLFGTFGHLKKCRLPKKFDGGHRGFAFVEYMTKQEATNAMNALRDTHLYGRHVILEYAYADDDIEDIREKTQLTLASMSSQGNRKRNMEITLEGGDNNDDGDEDMGIGHGANTQTKSMTNKMKSKARSDKPDNEKGSIVAGKNKRRKL